MRFFYLILGMGGGQIATFVQTEKHPLHPEIYAQIAADASRKMALGGSGQLIPRDMVTILNVIELEEDVARARFPKHFEDKENAGGNLENR